MLDFPNNSNSMLNHVWIELTNKCNLNCSHCYAQSGPHVVEEGTLSEPELERLIYELSDLQCESVQFIGGEPTIHRSLPHLLNLAYRLNIPRVEVYSNIFSVPEDLWSTIKKTGTRIATSFYGSTPEIHDRMTNRVGSFEKTLQNIRKALDLKLELRVAMIVNEENEQDVNATEKLLKDIGVQNFGVDRVRKIGRTELGSSKDDHINQVCGQCWQGMLCIDPYGKMSPCIMSKAWPIGNLTDTSLAETVHSGLLRSVRTEMADDFTSAGRMLPADMCYPPHTCGPGEPRTPGSCHPTSSCLPYDGCQPAK